MRFKRVQQAYEAIMRGRAVPATEWDAPMSSGALRHAAPGFQEGPDSFGGFNWMLKNNRSKKTP